MDNYIMSFEKKYLKYKTKYLKLKEIIGGMNRSPLEDEITRSINRMNQERRILNLRIEEIVNMSIDMTNPKEVYDMLELKAILKIKLRDPIRETYDNYEPRYPIAQFESELVALEANIRQIRQLINNNTEHGHGIAHELKTRRKQFVKDHGDKGYKMIKNDHDLQKKQNTLDQLNAQNKNLEFQISEFEERRNVINGHILKTKNQLRDAVYEYLKRSIDEIKEKHLNQDKKSKQEAIEKKERESLVSRSTAPPQVQDVRVQDNSVRERLARRAEMRRRLESERNAQRIEDKINPRDQSLGTRNLTKQQQDIREAQLKATRVRNEEANRRMEPARIRAEELNKRIQEDARRKKVEREIRERERYEAERKQYDEDEERRFQAELDEEEKKAQEEKKP
jgi:hypothetical protein